MIERLQASAYTSAVQSRTSSRNTLEASETPQSGDTISLSAVGRALNDFFSDLGVEPSSAGISLEDIEIKLEQDRSKFESDVKSLFRENGIEVPPDVNLTVDNGGNVVVQGEHPQKETIETLFANNDSLSDDFCSISAVDTLVREGRKAAGYKTPYESIANQAAWSVNEFDDSLVFCVSELGSEETA